MDEWSNVHNHTVVCICVSILWLYMNGNVHLVDTLDTSRTPRAGKIVTNLALTAIKNVRDKFSYHIGSVMSHNSAIVTILMKSLETETK